MNPIEYEIMAAQEERHWWYRGLRGAIESCIRRFGLERSRSVLDAGCGTGGNLRLVCGLLEPSYLGGFDFSEAAVEVARRGLPHADLYQSDICAPQLRVDELDLVLSMDVICCAGFERSRDGLAAIVSRLVPGGVLMMNLPAFNWLMSDHDRAYGTVERYRRSAWIDRHLPDLGLEPLLASYRLCPLFPAVVGARLKSMLLPAKTKADARSDLSEVWAPINAALAAYATLESGAMASGLTLPWGSSLFIVARKPKGAARPRATA
jgi:SAM-dependent methyltransferase